MIIISTYHSEGKLNCVLGRKESNPCRRTRDPPRKPRPDCHCHYHDDDDDDDDDDDVEGAVQRWSRRSCIICTAPSLSGLELNASPPLQNHYHDDDGDAHGDDDDDHHHQWEEKEDDDALSFSGLGLNTSPSLHNHYHDDHDLEVNALGDDHDDDDGDQWQKNMTMMKNMRIKV